MTELIYREYPDLFESSAQITNHGGDSKGMYLILNQSLFYPQGGGQPADQGIITGENAVYKVFDVRNVDGEVRHYIIDNNQVIHIGCPVTIKIDQNRRLLNSKYHTAGHLIAAVVEKINPVLKAIKGHQFPKEAYIEFNGTFSNSDEFLTKITSIMLKYINKNASVEIKQLRPDNITAITEELPYEFPEDKPLRVCRIAGFSPVPCGGTHVRTLEKYFFS